MMCKHVVLFLLHREFATYETRKIKNDALTQLYCRPELFTFSLQKFFHKKHVKKTLRSNSDSNSRPQFRC